MDSVRSRDAAQSAIATALARWREAERSRALLQDGSPEAERADFEIRTARAEYRALYEEAERQHHRATSSTMAGREPLTS
jgi:hypothetical protein